MTLLAQNVLTEVVQGMYKSFTEEWDFVCACMCLRASSYAVSYTHLDVYKRQMQASVIELNVLCFP